MRGRWAYLYRAVDESRQVIDILLQEQRDLDSARAFFAQAIARRGVTPLVVITAGQPAYRRAVREHTPEARQIVTGLHGGPGHATPPPTDRSHVPVNDRVRPMRGHQSLTTGQWLVEGITAAQAMHGGHLRTAGVPGTEPGTPHQRARQVVAIFEELASNLRLAS